MKTPQEKEKNPQNTPEWEADIRRNYTGIISEESIEKTIVYWRKFISKVREEAYEKGKRDAYKKIEPSSRLREAFSDEIKQARLETMEEITEWVQKEKQLKKYPEPKYPAKGRYNYGRACALSELSTLLQAMKKK